MQLRAQGATEYLVLLAVVLIVALVSVALLGFFPGTASDAQITQSQIYWKSAQPISIIEGGALSLNNDNYLYLRIRNTGAYPIRIIGIVGADGRKATQMRGFNCGLNGTVNISDYFYMGPGEEKYFANNVKFGTSCDMQVFAWQANSGGYWIGAASSLCQNTTGAPGTLGFKTFGFEYIAYVEGQQITKRQIGKDWIVKCGPPS